MKMEKEIIVEIKEKKRRRNRYNMTNKRNRVATRVSKICDYRK